MIKHHLNQYDFDVRRSGNARFMDQKVTPDVLAVVAECIIEYLNGDNTKTFTKNDIWKNDYSNDIITEVFNKPNLSVKSANSEYDKFFAQPLKTLAYANILKEEKVKGANRYTVLEIEILQNISLRERNALKFLNLYLTKVLSDSDMLLYFDNFFQKQDKTSLNLLRTKLTEFYHLYTNIKGKIEPPRIFNKIINILAFSQKIKGTIRGNVSKFTLPIEEIRYNKVNWRDKNKDKSTTRQVFIADFQAITKNSYYKYSIKKAKDFVKKLHTCSEIHRFKNYPNTQAHHIFMASEFPELADYPENIITITPNQHFYRAHPNNKTSVLDTSYQLICLISKLDSIEINIRDGNNDYSLQDFIHVLNTGFDTDFFDFNMDYEELKHQITKFLLDKNVDKL